MPIHGKQHPDCQRKPINYDRDTTLPAAVGIFCCSWRDGAFFFFRGRTFFFVFFPRRDGAVIFFPRRDGVAFFFFDGTGRGGVFFCSRAGTGRLFLAVAFFLAGRGKIVTPSRQPST